MGFASELRGLKIMDTNFVYMTEGAYGAIFVDRADGKVRKVFLRKPDENHTRKVFYSEVAAYELASKVPNLGKMIPSGFKHCQCQLIIDKAGKDASNEFFGDMVFETNFIAGNFQKIGTLPSDQASPLRKAFHDAGIEHTVDMSVTLYDDGRIKAAIDFATEEHELFIDINDATGR